jgi:hypothetical protein
LMGHHLHWPPIYPHFLPLRPLKRILLHTMRYTPAFLPLLLCALGWCWSVAAVDFNDRPGIPVTYLADHEFEVSFGTKKPLGLQLDSHLVVLSFQRVRAGVLPPAEASGWIRPGDRLLAVNEEDVASLPLSDVVRKIVKGNSLTVFMFLCVASCDIAVLQRIYPRCSASLHATVRIGGRQWQLSLRTKVISSDTLAQ